MGQDIISIDIEQLRQSKGKIDKLFIKYKTAEGDEFYLKKDDDYDMEKVYELMKLMGQEMPGRTNEAINLDKKGLIVYNSLEGKRLRDEIIVNKDKEEEIELSAVKSADLIYDFHNLDQTKFKKYVNNENYNLKGVRFLAGRDSVQEIGQYNEQIALELDSLYKELSSIEEEILGEGNLVLIHGDFHPGNVLIDSKKDAKLIDYKNLTIGVRERDLASMMEQVYAQGCLGKKKTEEKDVRKWQKNFIDSYNGDIDEKKLIFYKSWISWRNATYCFSKYFLRDREEIDIRNGKTFIENTKKYLEEYKEK